MRVLSIVPSLNSITGGPATSSMLIARGLAKLGVRVELRTTDWPTSDLQHEVATEVGENLIVRRYPTTRIPGLGHVPYSLPLARSLASSRHQFDVFHCHSLWNPLISHTIRTVRKLRAPYAITAHGMLDPLVFATHRLAKTYWAMLWERANVEHASLIHFTSEGERTKAIECSWKFRDTLVMPIPVDLERGMRSARGKVAKVLPPELSCRFVIAFIGRINWVKNLHLLIEAFAKLRKAGIDAALVLAGPDDGLKVHLLHRATELEVDKFVWFTGLLSAPEVDAIYAQANVVALVSKKENFGLAAAEALASNVPVVLSYGVDMGTHWPAPPVWRVLEDPESIASGLRQALEYSVGTGRGSTCARDLAQAEWGDASVKNLLDRYERLRSQAI